MLFIGLVIVACLYVGLYLIYEAAQPHLYRSVSWMDTLNRLLMPEDTVFIILRGLILVTMLYLIGDFIISSARRKMKAKAAAKNEDAPAKSSSRKAA